VKRKKGLKIALYTCAGLLIVTLLTVMAIAYSVKHSVDTMYEPLSSIEWQQPSELEESQDTAARNSLTLPELASKENKGIEHTVQVLTPKSKLESELESVDETESRTSDFKLIGAEQLNQLRNPNLSKKAPFSLLLIGVDERPGDKGRSDTLILLTISPAKQKVLAISIPRDTRILLPQSESYDKINHAYAYGGTSRAVAAVERLFGIPIAYYMKTNMGGLTEIVNTVGGVDIVNQREFMQEGVHFPQGELHLNGEDTLFYIRMRKEDPNGDFGRTARQRQVLSATVDRLISVRSLGKFPTLLSKLTEYVKTNLTLDDMLSLAKDYKSSIQQVDTLYMQGKGTTIKGIYYWQPAMDDRIRIQQELLELLTGA
jgi:LCP family protein required for cell wall assembly